MPHISGLRPGLDNNIVTNEVLSAECESVSVRGYYIHCSYGKGIYEGCG